MQQYWAFVAVPLILVAAFFLVRRFRSKPLVRNIARTTAAQAVVDVINHARDEIKIISGELCHTTWTRPEILEALKAAIGREVKVNILAGPWVDIGSRKILRLITSERLISFFRRRSGDINHYVANDLGEFIHYQEYYPDSLCWSGPQDLGSEYLQKHGEEMKKLYPLENANFWDNFRTSSEENTHLQNRLGRQVTHRFTHSYMRLPEQSEIDNFLQEMGT